MFIRLSIPLLLTIALQPEAILVRIREVGKGHISLEPVSSYPATGFVVIHPLLPFPKMTSFVSSLVDFLMNSEFLHPSCARA
jgi:hypothetical protein